MDLGDGILSVCYTLLMGKLVSFDPLCCLLKLGGSVRRAGLRKHGVLGTIRKKPLGTKRKVVYFSK